MFQLSDITSYLDHLHVLLPPHKKFLILADNSEWNHSQDIDKLVKKFPAFYGN